MIINAILMILSRIYKYFTIENSNYPTTLRYIIATLVTSMILVFYVIGLFLLLSTNSCSGQLIITMTSLIVILMYLRRLNHLDKA